MAPATYSHVVGIFVGGQSRRMGGVAKGLLPTPETGQPILEHLVQAVRDTLPDALPVLVGTDPRLRGLGLSELVDEPSGTGPIGGLISLLRLAKQHDVPAIALAADLPRVTPQLLRRLAFESPTAAVLAPCDAGIWHPLFARYLPAATLPAALDAVAQGQRALHRVIDRVLTHTAVLALDPAERIDLQDWDAPSDIASSGRAASPPSDLHGRHLRDLRLSVTDRCNFRCGYCMPKERFGPQYQFLPRAELLSFDEIERLARVFVERLGVRKLRLTGGEPLLRPQLPTLVRRLARIPGVNDLSLTTNGYLLAPLAQSLADAGLDRITVSLDALDPVTFARGSGAERDVTRVLAGIDAAAAAGLHPLKINCVVQRGVNEHAVDDLIRHFRGTGHVVRFIEYMDVGTLNDWHTDKVVPASELLARIQRIAPIEPLHAAAPGEVAERYRFLDGSGEFGVIASITRPFCSGCQRARLSAHGKLLTCLFANDGLDLRAPLRAGAGDAALEGLVRATWQARNDRYSEQRASRATSGRRRLEMYQIGG